MASTFYRRTLVVIAITITVMGVYTLGFLKLMELEGKNYTALDAFYWVVTTITTVGFGDIVFESQPGKLFTLFVEVTGLLLIFGIYMPFLIMPWVESRLYIKLPEEAKLSNHIVICGYSDFIEEFISQISEYNIKYVVIEDSRDKVIELLNNGIKCIYGKFTEETFEKVNLPKARLMLCSYRDDAKNAEILLTARFYRIPKFSIVEDPRYSKFLTYAGATKVISPRGILGVHMAKKARDVIRHEITSALEVAPGLRVAEIFLTAKSRLVGKTLREAKIRTLTGCSVLGVWRDGGFIFNPPPEEILKSNSVLLAVGTREQLNKLLSLAVGR